MVLFSCDKVGNKKDMFFDINIKIEDVQYTHLKDKCEI